jgi:hypothetical protein
MLRGLVNFKSLCIFYVLPILPVLLSVPSSTQIIFPVILQPYVYVYTPDIGSTVIPVYLFQINRYNHIWKQKNLFK